MIFVTVGTHEQPFDRLIQKIDELKRNGIVNEEVIIQTGYSTYEPKYCQWSKLLPYEQMVENVAKARIVVTHGGPASFIMPLQLEKYRWWCPGRANTASTSTTISWNLPEPCSSGRGISLWRSGWRNWKTSWFIMIPLFEPCPQP